MGKSKLHREENPVVPYSAMWGQQKPNSDYYNFILFSLKIFNFNETIFFLQIFIGMKNNDKETFFLCFCLQIRDA